MVLFRRQKRKRMLKLAGLAFILMGLFVLVSWQLFTFSGEAASFYDDGQSESQVLTVTHESSVLKIEKHIMIYLPPGYEEDKASYPVLYLLRGQEHEWFTEVNFNGTDQSRLNGTVKDVMDSLIKEKAIGKTIVVAPSMTSDVYVDTGLGVSEVIYSFGVNMKNPPSDVPGIGTGNFDDYLVEVVNYIDNNYRTLADRNYRAIDGFSLGGFVALKAALQHPDLFSLVGSYDSPVYHAEGIDDLSDESLHMYQQSGVFKHLLSYAFDFPLETDFFKKNNPANLILEASEKDLAQLTFFIQASKQGAEGNFDENNYLIDMLASKKIANKAPRMELAEGAHNFGSADRHVKEIVPIIWQMFKLD